MSKMVDYIGLLKTGTAVTALESETDKKTWRELRDLVVCGPAFPNVGGWQWGDVVTGRWRAEWKPVSQIQADRRVRRAHASALFGMRYGIQAHQKETLNFAIQGMNSHLAHQANVMRFFGIDPGDLYDRFLGGESTPQPTSSSEFFDYTGEFQPDENGESDFDRRVARLQLGTPERNKSSLDRLLEYFKMKAPAKKSPLVAFDIEGNVLGVRPEMSMYVDSLSPTPHIRTKPRRDELTFSLAMEHMDFSDAEQRIMDHLTTAPIKRMHLPRGLGKTGFLANGRLYGDTRYMTYTYDPNSVLARQYENERKKHKHEAAVNRIVKRYGSKQRKDVARDLQHIGAAYEEQRKPKRAPDPMQETYDAFIAAAKMTSTALKKERQ